MFAVEVDDRDRKVAIAVAEPVRLLPILVHGQFEFEPRFGVAEVNERECLEVQPVGDIEPECIFVEIDGSGLVENPDHAVDRLGQISLRSGVEAIMRGADKRWWQPVTTPEP